ncbi:enkurin domain-containing protein [Pseudomonas fluorescens]|uniref:enkurin domain-containing protein n=2 Tax=Pseudomonas TaxID=286 RepID=UPI00123F19C4|nr:enkurin domain-containing protein [Pseudomonas fluorescens]
MNITNINWATHEDFLNPVRHTQLDHAERLEVLHKLKQRQDTTSPSQAISLAGATLTLESGSTLERALQPGR